MVNDSDNNNNNTTVDTTNGANGKPPNNNNNNHNTNNGSTVDIVDRTNHDSNNNDNTKQQQQQDKQQDTTTTDNSWSTIPTNAQEQLQLIHSFVPLHGNNNNMMFTSVPHALSIGVHYTDAWPELLQTCLQTHGPNELPQPKLEPYWKLWVGSFQDIMMILLVVAMIVLYVVGDAIAATAILVILMIATNIGAYTEYTSKKAAAELGDLPGQSLVRIKDHPDAIEGWIRMPNSQLVPGLVVQLKTGDIIPADAVILQTTPPQSEVSCVESMLTGESEPVSKFPFPHGIDTANDPHAHAKAKSMTRLYMGTEFNGECLALIVQTGVDTQMGEIFQSMADHQPEQSPLQIMIDRLIFVLAMLSILVSVINAAICIPTGRGIEPDEEDPQALVCSLNSVALTVAAVPENLPVALVIALAAIIHNLAGRGVIVKSLPAGEELSRLNYVFSDKTGTLTENKMTARAVVTMHGVLGLSDDFTAPQNNRAPSVNSVPLTDHIRLLAAQAQDPLRSNPTGMACLQAAPPPDNDKLPNVSRLLLETATSQTKMARIAVTINNQKYLVKVGSDWVLSGVSGQATLTTDLTNWKVDSVDAYDHVACRETIDMWAGDGYRVICVVAKPVDSLPDEIVPGEVGDFGEGFVFLGCLAIQDPPREDVAENIRIIREAGVVVSMITGDNPITGMSIARQIGLASDYTEEDIRMCLINAFELFHDVEEEEAKREIHSRLHYSMTNKKGLIIGRVSPFQKKWFVDVAKSMGLVVAMTGDGANDAPALRSANVGIAMGNGSDIAKAAGHMILVDPSFSGIVEAIRAGRLGFDNILKFLLFLLGTNISEVVIYLGLTIANVVITLDALNLLVLNLLTDGFPAIALSLERAEGDLMKRSPLRRDTSVLNRFTYMSIAVTNTVLVGAYLVVILLGNVWHLGSVNGLATDEVEDYDKGLEKTRMMFILLINISELLLGFSHRAPDRSVFSVGIFSGKWMNLSCLSSAVLIIFMTHTPGIKDIMRTEYLDWQSYLLVAAMAVLPFIVHEIFKVVVFQRYNFNVYELYKYEYEPEDIDLIKSDEERDVENGDTP